jgi:hypothetical protein
MNDGHRSTDRERGVHVVVLPGGLPVIRIVLDPKGGLGSIGIGRPALRALLDRLGRGLTGEAA